MTKNQSAKTETATACECSRYDALIAEQLTEEALENGSYDIFTTGCTSTTRNLFAPGHDAKLKSFLIRHGALGHEIRRTEAGVASSAGALVHADRYEFGHMVRAGIAKAEEKAKAKAEREAARAAKKGAKSAERKLAESAGIVKPLADVVAAEEAAHAEAEARKIAEREQSADWDDAPAAEAKGTDLTDLPEVIAKVGRWEYKGIVSDEGVFHYLAKDGHTRKTAEAGKFTVVREV